MILNHVADQEPALKADKIQQIAQRQEHEPDRQRRVEPQHRDAERWADLAAVEDEDRQIEAEFGENHSEGEACKIDHDLNGPRRTDRRLVEQSRHRDMPPPFQREAKADENKPCQSK